MVCKRLAALLAALLGLLAPVGPVLANDATIGVGIGQTPGQPRYSQSGDFGLQVAFDLIPAEWRFSFAQTTFDSDHHPVTHIQSQVFGAEKLFIHRFDERISMNGGLGLGLFQVAITGAGTGTGSAFGLMATVGGRVQINSQLFTEVQYQYRNAAIAVDSRSVVDAGWRGFAVNLGFVF
jgi:hypothetical protein